MIVCRAHLVVHFTTLAAFSYIQRRNQICHAVQGADWSYYPGLAVQDPEVV